jgi:hypothetical protein
MSGRERSLSRYGVPVSYPLVLAVPQSDDQIVLRMPAADWPDPARRGLDHINAATYVKMHGPSEVGISASATLAEWSRFQDLGRIDVPTLVEINSCKGYCPRQGVGEIGASAPARR